MTSQSSPFDGVVLDLSGVLITPVSTVLDELAGWHKVPVETMVSVLMGPRGWSTSDHPWHRAERGDLAVAALQDQIVPFATAAGLTMRGDEYARLLSGDFVVNDDVLDRIATLRTSGFAIGLLMNGFRELRSRVESRVDFAMFDAIVESCEVGCRKPEPEIFDIMTQELGVHPSRIVYLDDVPANIDSARQVGWRTIHVSDLNEALNGLDRVLANEEPGTDDDWSGGGASEDRSDLADDLLGGGAWREDGGDPGGAELVEVVVGDDAADDHGDVAPALPYFSDDQRSEGHVSPGEHGQADRVDVFVNGGGGDGLWGLEQTGVDDFVAGVAQDPGNDLDPPVVAVEPDLGDQDPLGHQITGTS